MSRQRSSLQERVLSEPDNFPPEFLSWLPRFLQDNINVQISKTQITNVNGENWHKVGDTAEPAFQNGWVYYGSPYNTPAFYKDYLGIVHIRGLVKSGTIGTAVPIFTLPAGYRPEGQTGIAVEFGDATGGGGRIGRAVVYGSGNVCAEFYGTGAVGAATYFFIDNIHFRAYS